MKCPTSKIDLSEKFQRAISNNDISSRMQSQDNFKQSSMVIPSRLFSKKLSTDSSQKAINTSVNSEERIKVSSS